MQKRRKIKLTKSDVSLTKTQKVHAWQIKEGVAWKGSVIEV